MDPQMAGQMDGKKTGGMMTANPRVALFCRNPLSFFCISLVVDPSDSIGTAVIDINTGHGLDVSQPAKLKARTKIK